MTTPAYLKNRSGVNNRYSLTKVHIDDFVASGRRRYGLWKVPALRPRPELLLQAGTYYRYTVTDRDIGRIDLIAYKYYGDVSWWWVIATYNKIANPLTDLTIGTVLLLPQKELVTKAIESELSR